MTKLYVGPQDQDRLKELAPGLELVVDYGWLTIIAQPMFWLLKWLHTMLGNWGLAIIALTVIIKAVFFPLSAASYKSMARMKKVTPRLTQIRERFGNDRMKMNQAHRDPDSGVHRLVLDASGHGGNAPCAFLRLDS